MQISAAYIAIILIWSTTPLAIQWSSEGEPLFSVTARMVIGVLGSLILARIMKIELPLDKNAKQLYLASGLSTYLVMAIVYWSAQYIPSGWISVIFGLSPIITGLFAYLFAQEKQLTRSKIIGMMLGFAGLAMVFSSGLQLDQSTIWGITGTFIAVTITSISSVWIKHLSHQGETSGLAITIGGLIVSIPFFILTTMLFTDNWLPTLSGKAWVFIFYLGLIGTTLGFTLYYFLLRQISATRVALIMLITPVNCLLIGSWLNNEPIVLNVWIGALMICTGLFFYELKNPRPQKSRL